MSLKSKYQLPPDRGTKKGQGRPPAAIFPRTYYYPWPQRAACPWALTMYVRREARVRTGPLSVTSRVLEIPSRQWLVVYAPGRVPWESRNQGLGCACGAGWGGPWALGPTEPRGMGRPRSDPAAAALWKSWARQEKQNRAHGRSSRGARRGREVWHKRSWLTSREFPWKAEDGFHYLWLGHMASLEFWKELWRELS